ncbi:MAG: FecR domain-containing protein [Pseudomonadota bacterium]
MMLADWEDIRAEAHLWRSRRQEGATAEEQADFEKWIQAHPSHADAYAEAQLFWEGAAMPGYAEQIEAIMAEQQAAEEIAIEALQTPDTTKPVIYPRNPWISRFLAGATAIAAMIVAAIIIGVPGGLVGPDGPQYERFANDRSKAKQITISDGSRITLAPDTALDIALTETERRARLISGDAFFTIASNPKRPFTVATEYADVTVTGTAFDIQLQRDTLSVAVREGSVRVDGAGKDTAQTSQNGLVLGAGQGVEISKTDGFGEVIEVFPGEIGAWRNGRLIYRDASLDEVVADLNRYSDVPIILAPSAKALRVSGAFDTNNMEFVFEGMRSILPVRIDQSEEHVRISRR